MPERFATLPVTLRCAAAVEAVEGAGLGGFGLLVSWETIMGQSTDAMGALGVTLLALLGGGGMLLVARGLWQGLRWSRSPAVLTQLFALPVAVSMVQSEQYGLGVPLAILALAALVLVLSKPSTRVLAGSAQDDQDD